MRSKISSPLLIFLRNFLSDRDPSHNSHSKITSFFFQHCSLRPRRTLQNSSKRARVQQSKHVKKYRCLLPSLNLLSRQFISFLLIDCCLHHRVAGGRARDGGGVGDSTTRRARIAVLPVSIVARCCEGVAGGRAR